MNPQLDSSSDLLLPAGEPRRLFSTGLLSRIVCLVALFVVELIVISTWLDTSALVDKGGLAGAVGDFGAHTLRSLVVFSTVLVALGYSKAKINFERIGDRFEEIPAAWGYLAFHCAAMSLFALLSSSLFARAASGTPLVLAWLAAGLCGIATAISFFIPPAIVRELAASTGSAWIYATGGAAITPVLVITSRRLWEPATALTLELVRFLLGLGLKTVVFIPATKTIGTQKFSVEVLSGCSGMEGVGLMLLFSCLWLWFFRSDYRFPQVLLLIPVGVFVIFFLNAVRIALLILIGNAGATAVALGGFHSQAGWIAFNAVALGLASMANRVPYFSSRRARPVLERTENPTEAYLAPFLAILAATMISRAVSGTFEWMYPLRFVAAAAALFVFRRKYRSLDWSFGWLSPLVGGLVFALWIGLDRFGPRYAESGVPPGLSALPAAAGVAWIIVRVLAAVITVPIAEELAFRGFLLRRLISADFESASLQRWTLVAVSASSLAFGLLHGDRWIAGTVAGLLYAATQKWRGRIGDAVVAHGVTNALIAIWVLWGGHWSLW